MELFSHDLLFARKKHELKMASLQEIQKREALIAKMEAELKALHNKKFPSSQVAKEIAAQYPQLLSLTLARGEHVDMLLKTGNGETTASEKVMAIIKLSEPLDEKEMEKLKG